MNAIVHTYVFNINGHRVLLAVHVKLELSLVQLHSGMVDFMNILSMFVL